MDKATHSNVIIVAYLNDGNGQFTESYYNGAEPGSSWAWFEVADFDGDSRADAAYVGSAGELMVRYGNGDGTFGSVVSFSGLPSLASGLSSGDFNRDGLVDIASVDYSLGQVIVALAQPGRTFSAGATYNTNNWTPFGLAASTDVDGDGNLDIVVAGVPGSVLFGNGDGTFLSGQGLGAGNFGHTLNAADVDGDGRAEITNYSNGQLTVVRNSGGRTFLAPDLYTVDASGTQGAVEFADINRDGNLDIIATSGPGIYYLQGNADGTFQSAVTAITDFGSTGFGRFTIFDANSDGLHDLAIADAAASYPSKFTVAFGDAASPGSGTSGATTLLAHIDLTSVPTALSALDSREQVLSGLTTVLGTIGAYQSRLQSVVRRLQGTSLEYDAARHRIVDADIAEESSKLIALTIRQQVATSLLAQANQIPALALRMLK
jgi:flagellin-like hook-associated protein FlgL